MAGMASHTAIHHTTLVILKRAFELRLAFERLVNAAFKRLRWNLCLNECLGCFLAFGGAFESVAILAQVVLWAA